MLIIYTDKHLTVIQTAYRRWSIFISNLREHFLLNML